jgi:hypothetical protein
MTWRSHVALLIGLAAAFLGTAATVSAAVATEGTDGSVYAGAMMFDEISSEGIEAGVEDGTASLEPVGTSDVASFVRDLYVDVLGRDPDPAGYDHWISGLSDRSMDGATVAYGFIFSEEYISRNTTDEDYVKMLYRAILGREADKSGLEAWTRNLGWGETRYGVFAGFVRSEEFVTECSRAGFNAGSYRSNYIYDKNVSLIIPRCVMRIKITTDIIIFANLIHFYHSTPIAAILNMNKMHTTIRSVSYSIYSPSILS